MVQPSHEVRLMAQAFGDAIGATKRQVQIWTDAGVLQCLPETNRRGRGRQRIYDRAEIPVAALVAAMGRLNLPVGDLLRGSMIIRALLDAGDDDMPIGGHPAEWYRAALRGEMEIYIVMRGEPVRVDGRPFQSLAWLTREQMLNFVEHNPVLLIINLRKVAAGLGT